MRRREFTPAQKAEIVRRATDDTGTIRCEKCKLGLKKGQYEIDHVVPEGLRPEADKQKPLTTADGQLLGTDCCHRGADGKTNADIKRIAKAKRQEKRDLRLTAPVAKIQTRPSPISVRTAKNKARERVDFTPRRNPFTREPVR